VRQPVATDFPDGLKAGESGGHQGGLGVDGLAEFIFRAFKA
jgi:hypothetical protein